MKSFTIVLLTFLTSASVDSDINGISISNSNSNNNDNNNTNINDNNSSSINKNNSISSGISRANNINNFNTSIAGDSFSLLRDKRGTNFALDQSEIARQNQITQQILSQYLERRLFPNRNVSQKIPTIEDILPKPKTSTVRPKPRGFSFSSPSLKRGSAKKQPQQRKIYGNSHRSRNYLQKFRHYTTTAPRYGNESDEDDSEKNIKYNGRKRQKSGSSSSNSSIYRARNHDDHNEEEHGVEEEEEEEEVEEEQEGETDDIEPIQRQKQQQLPRHQSHKVYRFLENINDPDPDVHESLQSVESEQHDNYYSSSGAAGDIFLRDPSENEIDTDCPHCVDEMQHINKWTMPLLKLGEKRYYLGIFFKANWFKAAQYCRYHGMHLASISSQEENDRLEKHIRDFGLGHEHFWISGTDLADEGSFFWMSTGRPITFTNWNAGEPNNFRYENGEEENCLELWNRDGKGLKWNDSPCSFETYFVCEVQPN